MAPVPRHHHPDGSEGYSVYIDGVLRANDPYIQASVSIASTALAATALGRLRVAAPPILSDRSACAAARSRVWVGDTAPVIWDPRRYFLGKVAHFAVWDSAMTQAQVTALVEAYQTQYGIDNVTNNDLIHIPPSPPAPAEPPASTPASPPAPTSASTPASTPVTTATAGQAAATTDSDNGALIGGIIGGSVAAIVLVLILVIVLVKSGMCATGGKALTSSPVPVEMMPVSAKSGGDSKI